MGEKDNSAFNSNPCFCLSMRHYFMEALEKTKSVANVDEAVAVFLFNHGSGQWRRPNSFFSRRRACGTKPQLKK